MKRILLFGMWFSLICCTLWAQTPKVLQHSVAGFFPITEGYRTVFSMNPAWRFHKGDVEGAHKKEFNDNTWKMVSLPDGMELLPVEASGCSNYQGIVWYRKHFRPEAGLKDKKIFLHFEAIMGKCTIWLNGKQIKDHTGGFLPIIVDITEKLDWNSNNVIAVQANNSNDPSYPPGKPQETLDFAYFGGIYRDCWLIAHHRVHITDPNYEQQTAGGGLFISYGEVSEKTADIRFDLHIRNEKKQTFKGAASFELINKEGKTVKHLTKPLNIAADSARITTSTVRLKQPHLWSPDDPYLYQVVVKIKDNKGQVIDGYMQRMGIRSLEFKAGQGFWLNGKPYEDKIIGANRHQDFAVVGNALSNSLHWRDAKKLRDAGFKLIRNAHYPQDPAFMDACDELGLFVIVNTPGWQFWNDKPSFANHVVDDIRQMVRRDRNHASVWLWEPILNETYYPEDFALRVRKTVEEEYPFAYCATASDESARGAQYYKVQFRHPYIPGTSDGADPYRDSTITYFTREFGDNVDNWNSHNSPSRASRAWGEQPMLVQAKGYANPDWPYTCLEALYQAPKQHIGGALWHSFDHQRGYHPDPFYGGVMDNFRQPKYSYYMFMAQRPIALKHPTAESGPMVYIAHLMSPFSPTDVTVYSNCDTVRLTVGKEGKQHIYARPHRVGMPSPVITFKDVFNVMDDKKLNRSGKGANSYLLAEGITNGQVVASHKVSPSRRPSKLLLWADTENTTLHADGSDLVTIIAAIADENGVIKRLNNEEIFFEVEGEAELVGNLSTATNPRIVQWGTAPILLRTTTRAGKIKIRASIVHEGKHKPADAELILESVSTANPLLMNAEEENFLHQNILNLQQKNKKKTFTKGNSLDALKEVEKQQADFE